MSVTESTTGRELPTPSANSTATATAIESRRCVERVRNEPSFLRSLHLGFGGGRIYESQLRQQNGQNPLTDTATQFAADFLARMKARDPVEELLVMQMLWTHGRLGRLSELANQQEKRDNLQAVNDACDRAANTFRRQTLALAEYREPRKGDTFMAIRQANVAQQQVVQNAENPKTQRGVASDEQGSGLSQEPKTLPAHAGGTEIVPGVGPAKQALSAERGVGLGRHHREYRSFVVLPPPDVVPYRLPST